MKMMPSHKTVSVGAIMLMIFGSLILAPTAEAWTVCPAQCEYDEWGFYCDVFFVLIIGCDRVGPGHCVHRSCFGLLQGDGDPRADGARLRAQQHANLDQPQACQAPVLPKVRAVRIEWQKART